MKKKGFTLIELLVVIAIIAMLLAILMPALGKVKKLAQRLVCGTNLKGLGTACQVYGADYDDDFPVAGKGFAGIGLKHELRAIPTNTTGVDTSETTDWDLPGKDWKNNPGNISIGASLYLLVREADVGTKSFICKSGDEKAFDGANDGDTNNNNQPYDLVQLWDFGRYVQSGANREGEGIMNGPMNHVSYSYQLPYKVDTNFIARPASGTGSASMAIMADKNPWCDPKLTFDGASNLPTVDNWMLKVTTVEWDETKPATKYNTGWEKWNLTVGNSEPHGREGQNVMFGDAHVEFMVRSDVSLQNDNIYTRWGSNNTQDDKRIGNGVFDINRRFSRTKDDSMLVNDDECVKL